MGGESGRSDGKAKGVTKKKVDWVMGRCGSGCSGGEAKGVTRGEVDWVMEFCGSGCGGITGRSRLSSLGW